MNKKTSIMVTLLTFAILSTTLVGIAQAASYRGSWRKPPTVAPFEAILQTWGDPEYNANPPTKFYITDEGDIVMKNFRCHGIPPLIEDPFSATWDDYMNGRGGISLTINGDYTLIGTIERMVKINIFYGGIPATGVYAVSKWTFEITQASEEAPENAVGSTMKGWDTVVEGVHTYESTKGTGMFHGASMVFTTSITPVFVVNPQNPAEFQLFAHEEAEGDMLFP